MRIEVETPLQDDIRKLVTQLNEYMMPLTPKEFQFQLTVEQMAEPGVTLFVARNDNNEAVGMGALKIHDEHMGEVKRMFTLEDVRGERVGSKILDKIEDLAAANKLNELKLETGEAPGFEPAWRLYERNGYQTCGAFLDYPDSGYSRFYLKKIA